MASAPVACDTLHTRSRHAVDGTFGRLTPATDSAAGTVATAGVPARRRTGAAARGVGRVRKDGRIAVAKGRPGRGSVVRKDQGVLCPQLGLNAGEVAPYPTQPTFETPVPTATGGEVVPSGLPLPGARPRGFFVPPLIGGLLLGGGAIAIANRPGTTPGDVPTLPPTPTTPTPPTPTTPTPTTPTAVVPEPATVALVGAGLLALGGVARRRRR